MDKYTRLSENLQDPKKSGKERPWRVKKIRSLIIADSQARLGNTKKSERMKYCGTYLEFTRVLDSGERFLSSANFCRERLCPMCQWRRSLKVFFEVSRVMDTIQLQHPDLIPLFLTLTIRNCAGSELSGTLNQIFAGWHRFANHRKIKGIMQGWFRSLEITYNNNTNQFHPHIHTVILVDKKYFGKGVYLETPEWVRLWRVSLGLDYDPICDVRRLRNGKDKRKGIAEVAKYTLKDTEIATKDNSITDFLVSVFNEALKGRRLYAFGGLLKLIAAADPEEGDLVHVGDTTIRADVATVIERYRWHWGISNYTRIEESGTPENLAEDAI